MSIAFPMAFLAAMTCVSFGVYLFRRRLFPLSPWGWLVTIIMFPYVLTGACVPWFLFFVWLGTSAGTQVDATEAARHVSVSIPGGATAIDYSKHYHQSENVDLTIDEAGFLAWCKSQGWSVTPIMEETLVDPVRTGGDNTREPMLITDGYSAITVPIDGDYGGTVVYDRVRKRAFYRFHAF